MMGIPVSILTSVNSLQRLFSRVPRFATAILIAAGCIGAGDARAAGVSRDEIVLATIQDLTGPGAANGHQLRDGLLMRVAEINALGGINGRHVRLLVEDSAGDPQRAARAAEHLARELGAFAVLGQIGAAQNSAALPILLGNSVISFLPLSAARDTYEPPSVLKMAFWPSYADQVRAVLPTLIELKKASHLCAIGDGEEAGNAVVRAVDAVSRTSNATMAFKGQLRRGSGDLAALVARVKAENCDLVVLGLGVRDSLSVLAEARRVASEATFLGTSDLYGAVGHPVSGRSTEGLYAVNTVLQPYADDASRLVRDWNLEYHERFGEDPSVYSVYGYCILDLFARAAVRTGPNLTVASLSAVLESATFSRDMFGSPEYHISAGDRLGARQVRLSQVINGKWVVVTPLLPLGPPIP